MTFNAGTVTVTGKKSFPGEYQNILDTYRSVTYKFTLACVSPTQLKNPSSYRKGKLDFIIAETGGKGIDAMNSKKAGDAAGMVDAFNKNSPGAFDLYIDNVEIETIMAPNEQTGPALGTSVRFEVFEPYSVNGFIEALHVAGNAAGWGGYLNACFLLKIEFYGFPDTETGPMAKAKKIPADKYLTIKLTGAEIEVTEQGTRYRCKGIPINETAFSNPLKLTTGKQMSGSTVKEVLKDLEDALNKGATDSAENEKGAAGAKLSHKFKILFPEEPAAGEEWKLDSENKIGKSKINETLKENNVYKFESLKDKESNPNGSSPDKKYDPKNPLVQFAAGADVLDIITAVVRDSAYLEETLQKLSQKAKEGDGMIDYFQVIVKSLPLKMDETNNLQLYEYQFLVVPYRVHSSKLPDQQNTTFKPDRLKAFVRRKYDYLYGGKNVDVLSFKLNFNNLYFQAANPNLGNKPFDEQSRAAAPSNNPDLEKKPDQRSGAAKQVVETPSTQSTLEASSQDGRAGPDKTTPYWQLAMAAHRSILESVNLIKADVEILGDPYYLCTSGIGNYLPKSKDSAMTEDGEANFNSSPVVITVNFRNPIDIGSNGFLKFRDLAPFSGLYQVLKVSSAFREGVFKQNLKCMRYNGQLEDSNKPDSVFAPIKEQAKEGEQVVADEAPDTVQAAGVRPSSLNLANLVPKLSGFPPKLALPGNLAGIAAGFDKIPGLSDTLGALEGTAKDAASAAAGLLGNAGSTFRNGLANLNQGAGGLINAGAAAMTKAGGLMAQGQNILNQTVNQGLSVGDNLNGINPLESGIRLDTGALGGIAKSLSGTVSSVQAAEDKVSNLFAVNGSTLGLDQKSAVIKTAMATGVSPDLALRAAGSFGLDLPKVGNLNPSAMMSKLSLDPNALFGVNNISAEVSGQIKEIMADLPDDVDISMAADNGMALNILDRESIQNIPAIPPELTAPLPEVSPGDLPVSKVSALADKFGLSDSLANLKTNIPGSLSNLGNLTSKLPGLSGLPSLPNASAVPGLSDFGKSITSQLGSVSGASPLTKLMTDASSKVSGLLPPTG